MTQIQLETPALLIEKHVGVSVSDQMETGEPTMQLRKLFFLDELLLHCIDEALTDLVGIGVREAIYQKIETTHLIPRAKIPGHLDELFQLLGSVFGKGDRVIGRTIAKRLFQKLGWEFIDVPQLCLSEYLDMVRARLGRMTGPFIYA